MEIKQAFEMVVNHFRYEAMRPEMSESYLDECDSMAERLTEYAIEDGIIDLSID
jgi:hypothetical protein